MDLLIVSRGTPSKKNPTLGIFEFDQAIALKNAGNNVTVLSCDFRSVIRIRRFGIYKSIYKGIEVINISIPLGNLENPITNFFARFIIKKFSLYFKKNYNLPDIIHSHFYSISSVAVELKTVLNIPFIITEHSSLVKNVHIGSRLYDLLSKTYNCANQIITVSNSLNKIIYEKFHLNSVVIPNLIDSNVFNNKILNKDKIDFVFISVGSLDFNKGHDILLRAFSKAKFDKSVKLLIYGKGELFSELNQLVVDLQLSDNVILKGEVDREELSCAYAKSDAFVLASRSETFGLVFIEAMFYGLPVIGTKCGGPEDFINNLNGISVDPDNISDLSLALKKMKDNYGNYNSLYISNFANSNFSPEIISQKLIELYKRNLL